VSARLQQEHQRLGRQYLPKGTDPSIYNQEQLDSIVDEIQLDSIVDEINGRPSKGLGVRSPLAVYRELLINKPQYSTFVH
jgi:IS30 family transposase